MNLNIKNQSLVYEDELKDPNGIIYDPIGTKMASIQDLPDSNYILDNVIKILEYMNEDEIVKLKEKDQLLYEEKLENQFNEFSEKFYGIFRMIISNEDISPLFKMLSKIDKVKNGKISLENAEKDVGKYLTKFLPKELLN